MGWRGCNGRGILQHGATIRLENGARWPVIVDRSSIRQRDL